MTKALSSESYAAQAIRSGKCTAEEEAMIKNKYDPNGTRGIIEKWKSVDNTQYKIDDDDWNAAKDAGKDRAKEETGHDGSKQSALRVIGLDAAGAAATGAMAIAGKKIGSFISNKGANFIGKSYSYLECHGSEKNLLGKEIKNGNSAGKNVSDIITVGIGVAAAANYQWNRPNEDQHDAAMKLFNAAEGGGGLLEEGQYSLEEAQSIMEAASEETQALTEEAEEINEDANEQIEDDKTNFDFFRKQYEYLKAKAESGEKLTPDEKAVLAKLAPIMEQMVTDINDTQEGAATDLNDKSEEIAGFESEYDTGAETMAEVQGLTDFAEGFDSSTRTMAYIEGVSQGITSVTTGAAAARLATKGGLSFGVTLALAAAGGVAAVRLGFASKEQFQWAGQIGQEIDVREQTQDLGTETEEVYDTELDNFASNLDIIQDLEIEVPEDVAIPGAPVEAPAEGEDGGNVDPLAAGAAGQDVNGEGEEEEQPNLEDDPEYTDVMGKGSDYSDILSGKTKRGANDKLVTDENGKVVLTKTYAEAITSVTGDDKGKGYSKDFIPKIIAKVLGDPFTESLINKVKNGGKVDSEFAAKILKTASGEDTGRTGTVDNTEKATQKAKDVIDFYWPIFDQAASGWVQK